jgi:hypothetical protein
MKLKSKWDHHQGRNQAWKTSHRNTTNATFEMAHKFFFKSKKSETFTISTYSILASTIKISANFFYFLTLHQRSQRSLKGMYTFLRVMCTCKLKGLREWLLVVEKSKSWALWRMRSPVQVRLEVIGGVSCHWQWELVGWKLFKLIFNFLSLIKY